MADEMQTPAQGYVAPIEEDPEKKATEAEIAEVKRYFDDYKISRDFDGPQRKQYAIDRRYAAGRGDAAWAVDANLLGSYIDILVAYIFARMPEPEMRPTEAAVRMNPRERQEFAQTLEFVVRRMWKDGKLKKVGKRAVRSAYSIGPGWWKANMIVDTDTDPIVETELNDAQDNLRKIAALREAIAKGDAGGGPDDLEGLELKLEAHVESLEAQVEIITRKAMAIDFVRAENLTFSLDIAELEDYLEASWIAIDIYVRKADAAAMFPELEAEEIAQATSYYQRKPIDIHESRLEPIESSEQKPEDADVFTKETGAGLMQDAQGKSVEFLKVVEFWCREDNHIRTAIEGVKRWAKPSFMPRYPTSRFYSLFKVDFFQVDGERHPQSLTMRLMKLQDEYSATRSSFRLTRQRSIPSVFFNNTQIDATEAEKMKSSEAGEYIGLKPTDPDADFSKLFAEKKLPTIDGALFDTSPIIGDMEKVSGVQEAQQSSHTIQKTATQAEIEQSGFTTRTTAQRDSLEDTLADFAQYCAEIALQCYSHEEAQQMAGELAFWPENLPLEEIQTLLDIEIEAGSTGKPNSAAEREAWMTVLPVLRETMLQITEARRIGDFAVAEALTELVRETMRRLGDRIDVERFIPDASMPLGAPPVPGEEGVPGDDVDAGVPDPGAPPLEEEGQAGPSPVDEARALLAQRAGRVVH